MLGITDFPAFLLITTITVLLPGPNSLFVLSVAARQGVRDGYRAALGVFVGDGLLPDLLKEEAVLVGEVRA